VLGCIAAGLVTETRGVIIFTEDVGVVDRPLNVSIYQGWANSPPLEFSGTGQVQSNKASGAYEGASGQSNVFLNNGGRTLTISNIDTLNYSDFGFAFGADKSSTQSDLTELIITFDSAIGNGSILFPPQPTARGSKGWRLITATSVPLVGSADLSMTFRNTASTNDVQLDDITLSGAFRTAVETLVWNGGSSNGNWHDGNWTGNNAPLSRDSLVFAGSNQTATTNNSTALTIADITFATVAAPFTNAGNTITLTGGVSNDSFNLQTITILDH
jgi:hypothetical protein